MKLIKEKVFPIIMDALREDIGSGDITSSALFEKDVNVMADITAKEDCILAGIDVARWIFNTLDEKIIFRPLHKDGDRIRKGKKIISLSGSSRNILVGERAVLNFLGRLSGIATLTNRFVEKVKGTKIEIYDTRKTTPGLRTMEKYAVRIGGGCNHRMGLWDGILIKDNHLDSLRFKVKSSKRSIIKDTVKMVKGKGYKNVEIEVGNLRDYAEALDAGSDIIMLDNMKIEGIKKAVRLRNSKFKIQSLRPLLEVSGNVNLGNVAMIAKTGVDRISIGSLTHSVSSIDYSLEICR